MQFFLCSMQCFGEIFFHFLFVYKIKMLRLVHVRGVLQVLAEENNLALSVELIEMFCQINTGECVFFQFDIQKCDLA